MSNNTKLIEEIIKKNTKEFDKMIFNLIDYPHKYNTNYTKELEKLHKELTKDTNKQKLEIYKKSKEYNLYHKLQLQQHYFNYILSYYSGDNKSASESVNEFFKLLDATTNSLNISTKQTTIDNYLKKYFSDLKKSYFEKNTNINNLPNLNVYSLYYPQKIYAIDKVASIHGNSYNFAYYIDKHINDMLNINIENSMNIIKGNFIPYSKTYQKYDFFQDLSLSGINLKKVINDSITKQMMDYVISVNILATNKDIVIDTLYIPRQSGIDTTKKIQINSYTIISFYL